MLNSISELQSNAESRVDRVVQTLDTLYSDVLEQSAEYKIMELFTEYAKMEGSTDGTFHDVSWRKMKGPADGVEQSCCRVEQTS